MTRIVPVLAGLFLMAIAGCNTVEGFGQDVEQGGEALSDTANDAEQEIGG